MEHSRIADISKTDATVEKKQPRLERLTHAAIARGASDIHLSTGGMPAYRLHGIVQFFDSEPPLEEREIAAFLRSFMTQAQFEKLEEDLETDCSLRFGKFILRVNAFSQSRGLAASIRIVPSDIPPLNRLGLPPAVERIFGYKDGLILITGPTGSGKSTTIASIVNEFNKAENLHIVTIEDPIEYVHTPRRSLVNQREIGRNTKNYAAALRSALREDPDIIFVGEMRDPESIATVLTAAETGHLVLSTLHTVGAAKTIDRLIDVFTPSQQAQVRSQLSTALRAVISQRLLPRKDQTGRILAYETMFVNSAIANLIRENKIPLINQTLQTSRQDGMITLNTCLDNLASDGIISSEIAADYKTKN